MLEPAAQAASVMSNVARISAPESGIGGWVGRGAAEADCPAAARAATGSATTRVSLVALFISVLVVDAGLVGAGCSLTDQRRVGVRGGRAGARGACQPPPPAVEGGANASGVLPDGAVPGTVAGATTVVGRGVVVFAPAG